MKFRDPQYTVKSKYSKTEATYQGNTIQLPEDAFETKVDIDGLKAIFIPYEETREEILTKQEELKTIETIEKEKQNANI